MRAKPTAADNGASYFINLSSMTARENPPNGSVYAATKAVLVSLSNAAHAELSRAGVHVTALLPGLVDTPGTAWVDAASRDEMLAATDVARGRAIRDPHLGARFRPGDHTDHRRPERVVLPDGLGHRANLVRTLVTDAAPT